MHIALVLLHLLPLLNLSSFPKHEAKADVLGSNHRRCGVVSLDFPQRRRVGFPSISNTKNRAAAAVNLSNGHNFEVVPIVVGSSNSSNAASAVGPESFVFDDLRSLYWSIGWPYRQMGSA